MLNDAYDAGRRNKDKIRHDLQQGKQRAQQQKARVDGGSPRSDYLPARIQ